MWPYRNSKQMMEPLKSKMTEVIDITGQTRKLQRR